MTRIILVCGLIAGLASILGIIATIVASGGHHGSFWVGSLIMLVAFSALLIGVKRYRDRALGGVIKFHVALAMGLAIVLVADVAYVAVWEGYLALTHDGFMDAYIAETLAAKRAEGITGEAYRKLVAEMEQTRRLYADPVTRLGMTAIEILPVGALSAVASAALLRNPRFLPARTP